MQAFPQIQQHRAQVAAHYIQFTNCPEGSPYPNQTPFGDLAQHLQIPVTELRQVLSSLVQRQILPMHNVKGQAEKDNFEACLKRAFGLGMLLSEEHATRLGLVWGQDEAVARVNGYLVALLFYRKFTLPLLYFV